MSNYDNNYRGEKYDYPIKCGNCGVIFYRKKCKRLDGIMFCSTKCSAKVIKGKNHHNFTGFITKKCPTCAKDFICKPGERATHCSKKCGAAEVTADKNHNWKGGITVKLRGIRHSIEYRDWRNSVFERDNYICQICKSKNGDGKNIFLQAHHIENFSINERRRLDETNGITLCKSCHKLAHHFGLFNIIKNQNSLYPQNYQFKRYYLKAEL